MIARSPTVASRTRLRPAHRSRTPPSSTSLRREWRPRSRRQGLILHPPGTFGLADEVVSAATEYSTESATTSLSLGARKLVFDTRIPRQNALQLNSPYVPWPAGSVRVPGSGDVLLASLTGAG